MARSTWGSKRQKSRGVWELRYTVGGRPKSSTFRGTAREADRELAALRLRHEGREDTTVTVDAFFWGVFVPECEERVRSAGDGEGRGMSPTTLASYTRYYRNTIQERWGSVPLDEVRAKDVQAWLSGMTAGSARHAKAVFKVVMNRAEALEYVDHHPLGKRYVMPSAKSARQRTRDVFDADELDAIFSECAGEWWDAYFILAAFGGAQRAEAVGVKPSEVSYVENEEGLWAVAPVRRGVHLLDGEVVVVERGKNEYREGNLIVPPPYSSRLRADAEGALAEGGEWFADDGFGGPVDPEAVTRAWKRWLSFSPHSWVPFGNLRNSYSTVLHSLGLQDSTISKLMRHANLTTDYAHYNRLDPDALIGLMGDAMRARRSGITIPDRPISAPD